MENKIVKKITLRLSNGILEDLKNVVYFSPQHTLNTYVEEALRAKLSKEKIQPRTSPLKRGRKIN